MAQTGSAQPFTYTNNDLVLGFRKTGAFAGTFEVVVNIGKDAASFMQEVEDIQDVEFEELKALPPGVRTSAPRYPRSRSASAETRLELSP